MLPKINGEISMNTYGIEVSYVEVAGTVKRSALKIVPKLKEIHLAKSSGKDEHALVIWTFKHLPAGLTPVITFGSRDVIASGPTTTLGDHPTVTFEIRFPPSARKGLLTYPVRYEISASSGLTKSSGALPPPEDEPTLVVIRSPDPPPGGSTPSEGTVHAGA
jgi:hypothetical protein